MPLETNHYLRCTLTISGITESCGGAVTRLAVGETKVGGFAAFAATADNIWLAWARPTEGVTLDDVWAVVIAVTVQGATVELNSQSKRWVSTEACSYHKKTDIHSLGHA